MCFLYSQYRHNLSGGTWSVVPHVGVSFANLTNDAIGVADNRISHSQTRIGFSGGADVYYQLSDKLALSGGVAYTQAGCNFKDVPATCQQGVAPFSTIHISILAMLMFRCLPTFMYRKAWRSRLVVSLLFFTKANIAR